MPDEREKFTLGEMLEVFDIQRISLGGPVFDVEKLEWLNGVWIRDELSDDDLKSRLETKLPNHNNLDQLLPLVKPRMRLLSDYEKINPCGLDNKNITSIQEIKKKKLKVNEKEILEIFSKNLKLL